MNLSAALSSCLSPVITARVYNPMSPDYYLADVKSSSVATGPSQNPAVNITLSEAARAALDAQS